jgi:hypothetical protein
LGHNDKIRGDIEHADKAMGEIELSILIKVVMLYLTAFLLGALILFLLLRKLFG